MQPVISMRTRLRERVEKTTGKVQDMYKAKATPKKAQAKLKPVARAESMAEAG